MLAQKKNFLDYLNFLTLLGWMVLTYLLFISFLGSFLLGCTASQYLGSTTASYKITAAGPEVFYQSNKNQEGFKAELEVDDQGKPKKFHVETTATTPEAAIMAAFQSNQTLIARLIEAAIFAANKGIPSPAPAPAPAPPPPPPTVKSP